MQCDQVIVLCVGLFPSNYYPVFSLNTQAGEQFYISEALCFVYTFASRPEYSLGPSLSSFAWISCQPTPVTTGVTTSTSHSGLEGFVSIMFAEFRNQKLSWPRKNNKGKMEK